jgi:hypothetical protein
MNTTNAENQKNLSLIPPIARIRKSAAEEIWVSLVEWMGKKRIDLRIHFRGENGPQPTQKGVSLSLDSYEALREAIDTLEGFVDESEPLEPLRISKNRREEVRISIDEYKGRKFVSIRVFYSDKDGEFRPTRKGITFPPSHLAEMQKAINAISRVKT